MRKFSHSDGLLFLCNSSFACFLLFLPICQIGDAPTPRLSLEKLLVDARVDIKYVQQFFRTSKVFYLLRK